MYITLYAESILQCKRQFARNSQISEFHIFAPPNATPCTVSPGADAPITPLPATIVSPSHLPSSVHVHTTIICFSLAMYH